MTDWTPRRPPEGATPDPTFIGRGLHWPMGVDHTGSLAMSQGAHDIAQSMRVVLTTAPGERVMRPEFGCHIWDLLFEPVNSNTLGLMAEAVRQAMAQWEPRAEIEEVVCEPDVSEASLVRIFIRYRVRTTNDRRNLVYPFYVIPQEE